MNKHLHLLNSGSAVTEILSFEDIEAFARRSPAGPDQLYRVVGMLPVGISITADPAGREIRHNEEAAGFLRVRAWEELRLESKVFREGRELGPEEMPLRLAVGRGIESRRLELEFLWPDGVRRTALVSAAPLKDGLGKIIGAISLLEDITEKKHTERELQRYRSRFAELVEERAAELEQKNDQLESILGSITDAFYILDQQWRVVRINNVFAEMVRGIGREKVVGEPIWDIFPTLVEDPVYQKFRDALTWNAPITCLSYCSYTEKWFDVSAYPYVCGGLLVHLRDVTEKKQADDERKRLQEELARRESDYRTLLENAPLGIARLDREFRYRYCSRRVDVKDPLAPEDCVGKTWREIGYDEETCLRWARELEPVRRFGREASFDAEIRVGGQKHFFHFHAIPEKDANGQVETILVIMQDVTEKKQSEERFAKAFHANPSGMSIARLPGWECVDVNESFANMVGRTREEICGLTPSALGLLDDREREAARAQFLSQGKLQGFEIHYYTKSGERRVGLTSVDVITLGDTQYALSVLTDITQQKKFEAEIARLGMLNVVGEMAAGIAHEVRNPMTTIRGYLQMCQRRGINAKYREQFQIMIDELDRANSIISEFLSLAKNKAIDIKQGSLNAVVKSMAPLIQAEAFRQGHDLQLELCEIPESKFDSQEVRQLILNLSRNGLEAMAAGGVLTIRTYPGDGCVVLEVEDTGRGIADQILSQLGTPFVTTKENGTGLGLPVCYQIASRHNAKINVATSPQGTVFSVRFRL